MAHALGYGGWFAAAAASMAQVKPNRIDPGLPKETRPDIAKNKTRRVVMNIVANGLIGHHGAERCR